MRCFQLTRVARLGALTAMLFSLGATMSAQTVVETITHERFVGHVIEEDADSVRFESTTLGEIRIPKDKIRTITTPDAAPTAAAAATPPAQAVAAPTPVPLASPAKSWPRRWLHLPESFTASIGAGTSVRSRFIDQRSYTLSLNVGYATEKNVFNSAFQYEYMKAGPIVAADDFFWDNLLQHNWGARSFLLVGGRYREDQVIGLEHELNVFVAPGAYLVKKPVLTLGVAAGPNALAQDYSAAAPGLSDPPKLRDVGLAGYQFLQFQLLPRVSIAQNLLYTHSLEDAKKFVVRLQFSASLAVTEHLSLVGTYSHLHDSRPGPGVGESQNSVTSQLSYQF